MPGRIGPDAFELYASLGPDRSYQAIADHYGVTKRAVTRRAVKEDWSGRLKTIEENVRERTDEKIEDALAEMRDRHLRTIKAMQARALGALKAFPLTSGMEGMKAAEMAIKLERLIQGEASERTDLSIAEASKREASRWLDEGQ